MGGKIALVSLIITLFSACSKEQVQQNLSLQEDDAKENTVQYEYESADVFFMVNDSGVRLRDVPGVTGQIVRQLNKDEIVEYIRSHDLLDGSEYSWVNVKTAKETGWVYGEYLSYTSQNKFNFSRIEDAGLVINGQTILSGMHKNILLSVLGEPIRSVYDEDNNDTMLFYGTEDDLRFIVYNYNNKINHIRIQSSIYELANGIRFGMHIREVAQPSTRSYEGKTTISYVFQLRNRLRNESYDSSVIVQTDLNGIINDIHVSFPAP